MMTVRVNQPARKRTNLAIRFPVIQVLLVIIVNIALPDIMVKIAFHVTVLTVLAMMVCPVMAIVIAKMALKVPVVR